MRPRFLLDEHIPHAVIAAAERLDPAIDVVAVGLKGAPPIGALDPDILLWCEREQRILITNNRKSMPAHIAAHFASGHHHFGIFTTHDDAPAIGPLAASIHLIWAASEAEEHQDTLNWLP